MAKKETVSTGFDEAPIPPAADEPVKPRRSGPIMDLEMKTMNAINRALAKLPTEAAKIRVMQYMIAKIEFPLVDGPTE